MITRPCHLNLGTLQPLDMAADSRLAEASTNRTNNNYRGPGRRRSGCAWRTDIDGGRVAPGSTDAGGGLVLLRLLGAEGRSSSMHEAGARGVVLGAAVALGLLSAEGHSASVDGSGVGGAGSEAGVAKRRGRGERTRGKSRRTSGGGVRRPRAASAAAPWIGFRGKIRIEGDGGGETERRERRGRTRSEPAALPHHIAARSQPPSTTHAAWTGNDEKALGGGQDLRAVARDIYRRRAHD